MEEISWISSYFLGKIGQKKRLNLKFPEAREIAISQLPNFTIMRNMIEENQHMSFSRNWEQNEQMVQMEICSASFRN